MKTASSKILIAFLIMPMICFPFLSFSQSTESGKEKTRSKELKETAKFQSLGTLLESRKIAFQTEFVQPSTGIKIYNIVQIDGAGFYMRCENPPNTSGGYSGVRNNTTPNHSPQTGIFFEGNIENWDLTPNNEKKYYIIKFNALDKNGMPWGDIMIKTYSDKSAAIEVKSRQGNMIYSNYTGSVRSL